MPYIVKEFPAGHKVGKLWRFQRSEADEWVRSGGASSDGAERSVKLEEIRKDAQISGIEPMRDHELKNIVSSRIM